MTGNAPDSGAGGPASQRAAHAASASDGPARNVGTELGAAFPRTHHVLQLEFGDRKDFDDPRQEWRRLFSELLGTFALVLVAAGGGLLHAKGQISLAAAVVAPGLMVTAIILFMGAVSGAHLNPAVVAGLCAARGFSVEAGSRLHHHSAWRGDPGLLAPALDLRER